MNPLSTRPHRWRPITVFNLLVGLFFSITALGQPAFLKEGLVAYYPFNSGVVDESGNGYTPKTINKIIFSKDRFNNNSSSASFGSDFNSFIEIPNLLNDYSRATISIWMCYQGAKSQSPQVLFNKPRDNNSAGLTITFNDAEYGAGFFNTDGGERVFNGGWAGGVPIGTWVNYVLIVDGVSCRTFQDGKLVLSGKVNTIPAQSTKPFIIGALDYGVWSYAGELDDVRIYNRALSDGEVKVLYDYESTPPNNSFITNGLIAYYPFNGNANDESNGSNNGKTYNVTSTNDRFGQSGKAFKFGGESYINIGPVISRYDSATFSAWFQTEIKKPSEMAVVSKPNNLNTFTGMRLGVYDSKVDIGFANDTSVFVNTVGIGNTQLNYDWHHGVAVSQGGFVRIYLDGKLESIKTQVDQLAASPSDILIGREFPETWKNNWKEWGPRAFIGLIDDVRIYDRSLSDGEVKALYDYESAPQPLNPRIASATAQIVNGFVVGATITDGGYGYVENPVVTISGGGGTGAKATATQFNGVVTRITITNPGIGYTSAPTITIAPPPFPPRKATSTAQIVNGFVVGTKITDSGFGYDSPPAVLMVGGGGSGAVAVATVANGVVTAITITNPGTGYTSAPLVRIASPPFTPKLAIETSKVYVRMSVVLGRKYQLEASTDLNTWTTTGPAFIAQDEELAQEFDVNQVGRYFRINQVP